MTSGRARKCVGMGGLGACLFDMVPDDAVDGGWTCCFEVGGCDAAVDIAALNIACGRTTVSRLLLVLYMYLLDVEPATESGLLFCRRKANFWPRSKLLAKLVGKAFIDAQL